MKHRIDTPAPTSSPATAVDSRYCTLCCCCMSKELYLQLVFHCITGVAGSGLGSYCTQLAAKHLRGPEAGTAQSLRGNPTIWLRKALRFVRWKKLASKKLCKMSGWRWVFEKPCKMSEVKCCLWKTLQSVRRKTACGSWLRLASFLDIKTRSFWWRNGRHKYVKKMQPRHQQVINETHSIKCVPPLGHHLPTYYCQVQNVLYKV